jgi:RecA-family ATPase
MALSHFSCKSRGVLYLYLEDGEKVAQVRISKVLDRQPYPNNFHLVFAWDRGPAAVENLRKALRQKPDIGLVVIDCLAEIRGDKKKDDSLFVYDRKSLGGLQKLALEYQVAIVVVHHTRKAASEDPTDMISGTHGLASAADTTWIMQNRREGLAVLHLKGRSVESKTVGLAFDRETGRWRWRDLAEMLRSQERKDVIDYLEQVCPESASIPDVMSYIKRPRGATRVLLSRMATAGDIERCGHGKYKALDAPKTAKDESTDGGKGAQIP